MGLKDGYVRISDEGPILGPLARMFMTDHQTRTDGGRLEVLAARPWFGSLHTPPCCSCCLGFPWLSDRAAYMLRHYMLRHYASTWEASDAFPRPEKLQSLREMASRPSSIESLDPHAVPQFPHSLGPICGSERRQSR